MDYDEMKAALMEICRKHILPMSANVVLHEPYIPYIPDNWQGDLMLAEAQNLSITNQEYVERLANRSEAERINRLCNSNDLGIGPWDDFTMKIAYEAAFGQCAEAVAVSNGVLWSEVTENSSNKNPSYELIKLSSELWRELLTILSPKKIIACGKIALSVIQGINGSCEPIPLRLPSRTALSRVSGMFSKLDLLNRFPEVARLRCNRIEWFKDVPWGNTEQNKIFFACHAVSINSDSKRGVKGG